MLVGVSGARAAVSRTVRRCGATVSVSDRTAGLPDRTLTYSYASEGPARELESYARLAGPDGAPVSIGPEWDPEQQRRAECASCGYRVRSAERVACDRAEHGGLIWHFTDECWGAHLEYHSDDR